MICKMLNVFGIFGNTYVRSVHIVHNVRSVHTVQQIQYTVHTVRSSVHTVRAVPHRTAFPQKKKTQSFYRERNPPPPNETPYGLHSDYYIDWLVLCIRITLHTYILYSHIYVLSINIHM